jgi:thymidine phosphorylase
MSVPLCRTVGNAVEVAESVEVLQGGGPTDIIELTLALAREMLSLAGLSVDPAPVLASGAAYETWCAMITAQGGDPTAPLPTPSHVHTVSAPTDGTLSTLDALAVGVAAWRLGAGRARKEDPVQPAAGILLHAKPGDPLKAGDPLLELHTDTPEAIPAALAAIEGGYTITGTAPAPRTLILETLRG